MWGGDKEGECANLEKVNIVSRIHVRQSKAYHQLSQTKRQLQMEKPGLKQQIVVCMNLLQFYYTNRGIYSSIPLTFVSAIRTVTGRAITAHLFFKPAKPSNIWPVAMDFPAFHNFCKADIFSFNKISLGETWGVPVSVFCFYKSHHTQIQYL